MPNWIDLDGLVNLRDVGGMPTTDGGIIAEGRLLRSDNLQSLTDGDIAELRRRGLTDVFDLRSGVEVRGEGPGPMTRVPWVRIHHYSLFIEAGGPHSSAAGEGPEPVSDTDSASGSEPEAAPAAALPWVGKKASTDHELESTAHYLSYLVDRPDSVLAALRGIAEAPGASLVHCAAGKDRTGTVVALALLVAGAEPEAVVADYAASSERVQGIVNRLMLSPVYAANLRGRPLRTHLSRPEVMRALVEHVTERGGVERVLAGIGWTPGDSARLRAKLRDDPDAGRAVSAG